MKRDNMAALGLLIVLFLSVTAMAFRGKHSGKGPVAAGGSEDWRLPPGTAMAFRKSGDCVRILPTQYTSGNFNVGIGRVYLIYVDDDDSHTRGSTYAPYKVQSDDSLQYLNIHLGLGDVTHCDNNITQGEEWGGRISDIEWDLAWMQEQLQKLQKVPAKLKEATAQRGMLLSSSSMKGMNKDEIVKKFEIDIEIEFKKIEAENKKGVPGMKELPWMKTEKATPEADELTDELKELSLRMKMVETVVEHLERKVEHMGKIKAKLPKLKDDLEKLKAKLKTKEAEKTLKRGSCACDDPSNQRQV